MTSRPADLPDFEDPPVVEVVFGARFKTADQLRVFHIGLYRELVKDTFPEFQEQPPLLPSPEESLGFQFVQGPPPLPRCWFLDRTGNRLIQVQSDRFIHNWRKVTGEDRYPRYETIREEFSRRWTEFSAFLEREGLGSPTVLECELSYVNHIPKGKCWTESRDVAGLFAFLSDKPGPGFLPCPEVTACNLRYKMRESRGHLTISLGPAVRMQDQAEIIRFDLTARGPTGTGDKMVEWFDGAREWIVKGFTDLTSEKAHNCWMRKV